MKQVFFSAAAVFVSLIGFSQSRYTVVEYNKKDVPAVVGEVPFPQDLVRDAIDKNFEKLGYKARKAKDYLIYTGVVIKDLGTEPHDLYVMVDRKSRQDKDASLVTLLVGKGFDYFANDTADGALINNTKSYILSFREVAAAYDLELQILTQEDVIKKQDKKMVSLADDLLGLQKKRKKVDEDIAQNSTEQTNQRAEAARQQQILDNLKAKRKPAIVAAETATQKN